MTPSTNSGTSVLSAANSSMTMIRLGGQSGSPRLLELDQVLGALAAQQALAVVELGPQATERATYEVGRQVGDQTDAVRQLDALREGGAALVVDEQEGDPVRAQGVRPARAPRPGGTRSCPRPWCRRPGRAAPAAAGRGANGSLPEWPDQRAQAHGLLPGRGRGRAVGERTVLAPAVDHHRGVVAGLLAEQARRPRPNAGRSDSSLIGLPGVHDRREDPGQVPGVAARHALDPERRHRHSQPHHAGVRRGVVDQVHEGPAAPAGPARLSEHHTTCTPTSARPVSRVSRASSVEGCRP